MLGTMKCAKDTKIILLSITTFKNILLTHLSIHPVVNHNISLMPTMCLRLLGIRLTKMRKIDMISFLLGLTEEKGI